VNIPKLLPVRILETGAVALLKRKSGDPRCEALLIFFWRAEKMKEQSKGGEQSGLGEVNLI
jgi:hypothetical protein